MSKRGYIETPSLLGEFLFPKQSHKWVILDIDDKEFAEKIVLLIEANIDVVKPKVRKKQKF